MYFINAHLCDISAFRAYVDQPLKHLHVLSLFEQSYATNVDC